MADGLPKHFRVMRGEMRPPSYCRLIVIDFADEEIRHYPADPYSVVKWRGHVWRTPEQQYRLDKAYALRQQGLSYAKIAKSMRISNQRAYEITKKAIRERQQEAR
jgi:hypothetical protein